VDGGGGRSPPPKISKSQTKSPPNAPFLDPILAAAALLLASRDIGVLGAPAWCSSVARGWTPMLGSATLFSGVRSLPPAVNARSGVPGSPPWPGICAAVQLRCL
jgi:hypothetical protein